MSKVLGELPSDDDILRVEGIDVFFVGPGDLSNTLGMPGQRFHPAVRAQVFEACGRITGTGRLAGTLVNRDNAAEYVAAGFRLIYEHANAFLADGAARFRRGALGSLATARSPHSGHSTSWRMMSVCRTFPSCWRSTGLGLSGKTGQLTMGCSTCPTCACCQI